MPAKRKKVIPIDSRFLAIPQAAEYIGLPVEAMDRVLRNLKIPTKRFRDKVLIDRKELDEYHEKSMRYYFSWS